MKKAISWLAFAAIIVFLLPSCAIIREGEVGVKRTLGTYRDKPFDSGLKLYNPITSTIVKVSTQTENLEVGLSIPSKEGLNISAEVSILYNLQARKTPDILRNIGLDYEANIIVPVFRSAVADVSSRFYAKDMHTGERAQIEMAIRDQMMALLKGNGIEIEAVLLKSIKLPPSLSKAIEEKLESEQNALRMEFVLQQERQEAERKRIQAAGVRDAQVIIAEGLSQPILQFKALEAFMELSKSPNTKVIITDNSGTPLLMNPDMTDGPSTPTSGVKVNK
ncbi:MAG: prohibitin family protein [Saprospiraceae bacterium]|jgi:regulator of protease activity HflC (stomatin/prohibitin superfamily)|nr:prohibitin family protein [Saprospiraceae bacterium]